MNGQINEDTLVRMEGKLGRPIRRGLDKAMNEVMDLSEAAEIETDAAPADTELDCLNNNTKRCFY